MQASWRGALSQTIKFGWSSSTGRCVKGGPHANGTGRGEDRVGRRGAGVGAEQAMLAGHRSASEDLEDG